MNQQQQRAEIAALKAASSERVRSEYASLPQSERAAYAAYGRKALGRAEFDRIVAGSGPVDPAREQQRAELDRAMGLATQKLGCRREGSSLIFGILPAQPMAAAPMPRSGGALTRAAAAAPSPRPTVARQATPAQRPTYLSPHAMELDRRMGLQAGGPAVRREGSSVSFSAAAALAGADGRGMALFDDLPRKRKPKVPPMAAPVTQ